LKIFHYFVTPFLAIIGRFTFYEIIKFDEIVK